MKLTNQRPEGRKDNTLSPAQRRKMSYAGAQYSPTMEQWLPYCFDGYGTTFLEPRMTREKAMESARAQLHRSFHTEEAGEVWQG